MKQVCTERRSFGWFMFCCGLAVAAISVLQSSYPWLLGPPGSFGYDCGPLIGVLSAVAAFIYLPGSVAILLLNRKPAGAGCCEMSIVVAENTPEKQ